MLFRACPTGSYDVLRSPPSSPVITYLRTTKDARVYLSTVNDSTHAKLRRPWGQCTSTMGMAPPMHKVAGSSLVDLSPRVMRIDLSHVFLFGSRGTLKGQLAFFGRGVRLKKDTPCTLRQNCPNGRCRAYPILGSAAYDPRPRYMPHVETRATRRNALHG